jgi:hypothetical protein
MRGLAAFNNGAGLLSDVGQSVLGVVSESRWRTLLAAASLCVRGFRPNISSNVFGTDE